MARYDYGFGGGWNGPGPFRRGPDRREPDRRRSRARRGRVTSPYNLDYTRDAAPEYPVNPYRFGGAWPGQMLGEDEYRWRYMTRGGTNTSRGAARPLTWRYRRFGPDYGGRYPDEI